MVAARALQGIGASLMLGMAPKLIALAYGEGERGLALGLFSTAFATGISVGAPLGGIITTYLGWPFIFFINLPIGLITLVLGLFMLAESRGWHRARSFDYRGLVLVGGGLFCLVFGLVKADGWGWGHAKTIGFLAGGLVLLVAFGLAELRTSVPLVPISGIST